MKEKYSPAILASYVTFRELYNEGKYHSPYQILAEFVKYIVITEHHYTFSLFDMKNHLTRVFGFQLPTAVIKTAIKGIDGISKGENSPDYFVEENKITENAEFSDFHKDAEEENLKLSQLLIDFARTEYPDQHVNSQVLIQDFITYLVDEHSDTKHHNLISKFILANADNNEVKTGIESIRQGAILYTGLNYNISETGSLKKNLVLYLDTEILFNLVGLNGVVYQSIAEDFITLVKDANQGDKKVKLYYFQDVKTEIDRFFETAEAIVEKKQLLINKPAMKAIVNGCETKADVVEKQVDFFQTLKTQYSINEDPNTFYYSPSSYKYRFERTIFERIPDDDDTHDALKYVSHINVLRRGQQYQEYTESRFLFITETWRVLDVSRAVVETLVNENDGESVRICGFAQNMSGITNILWYKLNKGFGRKDYPHNLDAVLKAKIVLAKYISMNATSAYHELKQQYENGELSNETVAARMIAIRSKSEKPEDISLDTVEDELDFSPEFFQKYEASIEINKTLLREKDVLIDQLTEQSKFERIQSDKKISQLQVTIDRQSEEKETLKQTISNQQVEMNAKDEEILKFKKKEHDREIKKKLKVNWLKLIGKNLGLVLLLCLAVIVAKYVCNKMNCSFGNVISIAIGIFGSVPIVKGLIKNDYQRLILELKSELDAGDTQ